MKCARLVLLLLLFLVPAFCGNRAILIGISDYPVDPLTQPVSFASNDAALLSNFFSARISLDSAPVLLNTVKSTLPAVEYEVNRVLEGAGPSDTVYIFLSARGIASPGLDGYIGTANMVSSKPQSGGMPLRYLKGLIESSRANRVIILADVFRKPPEPFSNNIDKRVAELGNITKPAVAGVLASREGQRSEELNTHKPGYGVFGFFLADSALAGGGVSSLSQALLQKIENDPATRGKQKPTDFGLPSARSAPLWRSMLDTPGRWSPAFPKFPFQYASRLWLGGLLALQNPTGSRLLAIQKELDSSDPVSNPSDLAAQLEVMKNQMPPDVWQPLQDRAVMKLAGDAQRAVDRYGIQNLLPDDPLRVTPIEFKQAADGFAAALRIGPPTYTAFLEELRVRQLLCESLSTPGVDLGPLLRAEASQAVIPEVHNAIGAHFLESDAKDYDRAIDEFKQAKAASPGWMYPRHNLALAYIEKGDYRAAEREYRQAIASEPREPYLYYDLGLLLHRINRLGDAKVVYRQALDIYNKTIAELTERAQEWETRLPDDAALAHKRIDIFKTNRAEIANSWGALLATTHDFKGARQEYNDALMMNPDHCAARYNLAQMEQSLIERKSNTSVSDIALDLLNQNRSRKACAGFEPSLRLHARLELQKPNLVAARTEYEELLRTARAKNQTPNTETLKGMADVDVASGQPAAALVLLEEAITNQQNTKGGVSPNLFAAVGEARRRMADPAACRAAYEEAIKAASQDIGSYSKREFRRAQKNCDQAKP
jgi:tetratricopeptide (TPR) repeat protein